MLKPVKKSRQVLSAKPTAKVYSQIDSTYSLKVQFLSSGSAFNTQRESQATAVVLQHFLMSLILNSIIIVNVLKRYYFYLSPLILFYFATIYLSYKIFVIIIIMYDTPCDRPLALSSKFPYLNLSSLPVSQSL